MEKAEDIDLEFLAEDLPKLLNSMSGATDRINGISTSLRTFSRADTEHKVSAKLHEGSIEVQSQVGQGTEFYIQLPISA